ncbi:hypothetical protein [Bacillus sp. E(2018)]|uniref:hypothetical protein n=1 Tax=Bacillus sp. E(2018) TaxID=2502239 RepID=UPI001484F412|nr:hypothetical protein [Bacillus sp. E(2018)]
MSIRGVKIVIEILLKRVRIGVLNKVIKVVILPKPLFTMKKIATNYAAIFSANYYAI